ncbi:MAG TPA: 2-amino-4-hydroxy-6-hydroxymethyldihydropteridine diphosphokinase [Vicinamibacterales bacterium]|nr:2-amino-4-hydroxy-6-hydroxymethyldihydropteridine diphosphokinase [Vicinamibacterales bacterium]
MDRIAIALGSNVGDRRAHLDYAVASLRGLLTNVAASRYYDTVPVGASGPQAMYLNAALVGDTGLAPRAVLDALLAIETERGRERPYVNAPRTLDLDLILWGQVVLDEPGLVVPHPRFRERRFVLEPLAAVAPELRDPVSGKTVAELLSAAAAGSDGAA